MAALQPAPGRALGRKQRGDYPTPPWLVDLVVDAAVRGPFESDVVVVDPACGDGRFLQAAGARVRSSGGRPVLVGCDVDAGAIAAARAALGPDAHLEHGDALGHDWSALAGRVDVVVGNPPYLSQLAASTTRGGASTHGGGPYADAAVEFLALAHRLARRAGGRIGFVLPQSVLGSRDAAPVRDALDRDGRIAWSWWSPRPVFDAQVLVCALVVETGEPAGVRSRWTDVLAGPLGLPPLPGLATTGTLGDRARLTANFRDQYYGLVPAVVEDGAGPRFVPSGLIDPGSCAWGAREVRFARRRFARPTVELGRLSPAMQRWADSLAVPKVVVANQTRVIEAAVDADGSWLPGVPTVTARPLAGVAPSSIAAVLTSPVATRWAWQQAAGTGLSAGVLRLGPRWLGDLPWPVGSLSAAEAALAAGDVVGCGRAVSAAYGVDPDDLFGAALVDWWSARL